MSAAPTTHPPRRHRLSCLSSLPLAGMLLLLGPCPAHADSLSLQRQREILREALTAFDEAVSVAPTDGAAARRLYEQSAAGFKTLLDAGPNNSALHYNLANAYFRLGMLGRAILHYRRAERLDPADSALQANLSYARNRVEPYIAPTGGRRLLARLSFWTRRLSVVQRFWLGTIAGTLGWLGLALRLRWRAPALTVLAVAAIATGLASTASVAWQLHDEARRPPAVIVSGRHVLRLGRGEGSDPALNQPLGPGVELRIISERGGWVEVELADGKTGWLPGEAVERI